MKLIPYMKTWRTTRRVRAHNVVVGIAVLLCANMVLPALVRAQSYPMYTPVHIGTFNQIRDEFGNLLRGSAAVDASKRDLVQVLWASNSVIRPPALDGTPHPDNAPVENGTIGIGHLVSPALLTPGRFAASLGSPRPRQNSKLFVRVYNAPTLEQASFYTDSQLLTVRDNSTLLAEFTGATSTPIDPRDFDGDGLNNSWEQSLYSDPNNWDTDGDGMGDGDERMAGTDLLDDQSVFVAVRLESGENGHASLTWQSVPDKRYQVEFFDLMGGRGFSSSNATEVITADDWETQTTIPDGMLGDRGTYRVRLVE